MPNSRERPVDLDLVVEQARGQAQVGWFVGGDACNNALLEQALIVIALSGCGL
ncbi:MAG: hypothetical protein ACYSXF_00515 [Planctomycetota bacterium]